ncbi:hypothetical protein MmiHf6_04260 [Methanimicrococcus hongohii]|uniref:Type II-A CRISPR-associated protein Csn2 n=1 Tax=Methanimicrococcus hongohii TaxID=3028295 RepID=A0AA96UYS1_9EURY|nr:hypothetical protein MmiHf6_04260 [Methanimicrococcus sp. Hf6]
MDEPIEFKDGSINVLIIENPSFMTKMIGEIWGQSNNEEGGFELFENEKSLTFTNNVELIVNPFSADVNERDLLTKLYAEMKKDALDEELFMSTNTFLSEIEKNVREIMERQKLLLESETPDVVGLFKLLGVHFSVSNSLVERMCDYIDICSEYRKTKLFIFVNLKSFLTESEIIQLYIHSTYLKKPILLIENRQLPRLDYEIMRVIDLNLCEIPISDAKDNDIY